MGQAAGGEGQRDPQAMRAGRLGERGAAVREGDLGGDGEPEARPGREAGRDRLAGEIPPRPGPGASGGVETLEDVRQLIGWDAGAVVGHLDREVTADLARGDHAYRVTGGVHEHVHEQVVDRAAEQFLVAFAVLASYEQQIVNANAQALTTAVQQFRAAYAAELKKLPALLKTASAQPFGSAPAGQPPSSAG